MEGKKSSLHSVFTLSGLAYGGFGALYCWSSTNIHLPTFDVTMMLGYTDKGAITKLIAPTNPRLKVTYRKGEAQNGVFIQYLGGDAFLGIHEGDTWEIDHGKNGKYSKCLDELAGMAGREYHLFSLALLKETTQAKPHFLVTKKDILRPIWPALSPKKDILASYYASQIDEGDLWKEDQVMFREAKAGIIRDISSLL